MSILQELYYGNLCPVDRSVGSGSQYHTLSETLTQKEDALLTMLCDQQKALYESICDLQANRNIIAESELFVTGFRLGAQIILEILTQPEQQLKPL